MIKSLDNKEFVAKIHEIYDPRNGGIGSLEKAAKIVNDKYGTDINRFKLSNAFWRFDLYVSPPNGKPIKYYGVTRDEYQSSFHRLAAEWLKYLYKDLKSEKYGINYLSACYALFSKLYNTFLLLLQDGEVRNLDKLPKGITKEEIEEGKELYTLLLNKWVYV